MRSPARLTIAVGKFDQRLRCALSLKSKTTLPRWVSSSVARKFFAAATIPVCAEAAAPAKSVNAKKANAEITIISFLIISFSRAEKPRAKMAPTRGAARALPYGIDNGLHG
jgi:hypothetical protein